MSGDKEEMRGAMNACVWVLAGGDDGVQEGFGSVVVVVCFSGSNYVVLVIYFLFFSWDFIFSCICSVDEGSFIEFLFLTCIQDPLKVGLAALSTKNIERAE